MFNRFHLAKPPGGKFVSWADRFGELFESDTEERCGVDSTEYEDWNDEADSSGESSVS